MNSLTGSVTKRVLTFVDNGTPIVVGNVGEDSISVSFDSEWDGLSKVVTFSNGSKTITVNYANPLLIPHEVLSKRGNLLISIEGLTGDTTVLHTVKMANAIKVNPHTPSHGIEPTPATQTILAKLIEQGDRAEEAADNLDDMTVSASTSETATVNLDKTGSHWNLAFGLPKGMGVAQGGTTGQVLKKKSGTDYDTEWGTIDLSQIEDRLDDIEEVIPSQATSSNQLADKAFVNSSIGTNTANYISNNGQPFNSLAELQAYTGTVTNNDYAFVTGTDEQGNTYFDRYKATVTSSVTWAKEYRLNNSSFTASQWAAIQSGITGSLVTKLNGIEAGAEVNDVTDVTINGVSCVSSKVAVISLPTVTRIES